MSEKKRIYLFEEFVKLNEAEEGEADLETTDDVSTEPEEEEVKDKEHLPRLSSVVEKEFFKELKEHIIYWFEFDKDFAGYDLDSVEEETRAVVAWAYDTVDEEAGEKDPTFTYKIKYTEVDTVGEIEKVEEVLLIIHIYEFADSSNLVKQTEMKITLENVNGRFLKETLDSMKKRILSIPQSEEDVEDFKTKQKRRFGDNMY